MVHLRNPKIVAVLVIAVVVGAYFVVSTIQPKNTPKNENEYLGVSVHSLSLNEARLVNESGARWIRIDVSKGFGDSVANAKAYNLSVLGILNSWTMNCQMVFSLEEWRSNVTYYLSNYAEYVDAWEIWNEPANPAPNWTLLNLTIEQKPNIIIQQNMSQIVDFYFSMVQTASPIIRQYDPTAEIVLFGGLNLYSGGAPNLQLDKEFAQQLAAMKIEQYGDAISVHAYPWMNKTEPRVWDSYTESLEYYSGLFTNKSLEIWVTETGQSIEDGDVGGQSEYLGDVLGFFRGDVTRVFWYSLVDNLNDGKSFGLIDGTLPRPSYYALQDFIKVIDR